MVAAIVASVGLVGWLLGMPSLLRIIPGRPDATADAAVGILIACAAGAARILGRDRLATILAAGLLLAAVATLVLHAGGLLPRRPTAMSLQAAASLIAIAIAWLAPKRTAQLREGLAIAAFAAAYVAVVGHVYGAKKLWIVHGTSIAFGTALSLLALSTATMHAPPHGAVMRELSRPEEGGFIARRLLPIALVIPVVLGWLRLLGERTELIDPSDVATFLVVIEAAVFGVATWWTASVGNRVAAERAKTRAQLSEAIGEREVRARFVRALAHDLRTPLATVRAGAERLSRGDREADRDRLGEVVMRGVARIERMIEDLLDVERARAGEKLFVQRVPGDAAVIVDEIVHAAQVTSGQELEAEVERPLAGTWDPEALRRILDNLVSNALKHGRRDGKVTIRAKRRDGEIVFEVHNEGDPITKTEMERLLRPFERGHDARTKGWGIGLPLVRALVDALGGELEIESAADAGTTFRVRIASGTDRSARHL